MKKWYVEPELEIERFLFEDIITSSGLENDNTGAPDGEYGEEDEVIPGLNP